MKKKICVVTGTRAEYGLLNPLMKTVSSSPDLALQVVVTGSHLSRRHGLTYREIEKDGYHIDRKIDLKLSSDTSVSVIRSMSVGLAGFGTAFRDLKPDAVVLLGDRYEILCAAAAALVSRIPVGHIHGGERTEGNYDESIRHAVTKMSCLHFTSTEEYRKRVIQMGESPENVYNVGALALDNIRELRLLSREELENKLPVRFGKKNLLVTFHPVTLENSTAENQCHELLSTLDELKDTALIFTGANADTDGQVINRIFSGYAASNRHKSSFITSMGRLNYLSAMSFADGVVGNSSSGMIEAPAMRVGTVNIGDRQKGRIRIASVIDCRPEKESIRQSLDRLFSEDFQNSLKSLKNPFGDGHTAEHIADILIKRDLSGLINKSFFDIPFNPPA